MSYGGSKAKIWSSFSFVQCGEKLDELQLYILLMVYGWYMVLTMKRSYRKETLIVQAGHETNSILHSRGTTESSFMDAFTD